MLLESTGIIYRNEYGIFVLSDQNGNEPKFIIPQHIIVIEETN
jgi:hypothetical protein